MHVCSKTQHCWGQAYELKMNIGATSIKQAYPRVLGKKYKRRLNAQRLLYYVWTNRSIQVGIQTYLFCHVDRRHRQFALHSFVSIGSVCQATSKLRKVVVKMYKLVQIKESPQVSHQQVKAFSRIFYQENP